MKIGVLSDTHIPNKAKAIPQTVLDGFSGVEHIIHAGDISDLSVLAALEQLAPVTAVTGNTDTPETREALGEKKTVTLGGVTIGVFHGHGEKGRTLDRVLDAFRDEAVACIIFGHSHIPYCAYHGGVLLFNPGSPTDRRRNPQYSFGLLKIEGDIITPRLVYFKQSGAGSALTGCIRQ